jgi:membrane protease YdiL (CAAX protease family)
MEGAIIDGEHETAGAVGGGEGEQPTEGRRIPRPEMPGGDAADGTPSAAPSATAPAPGAVVPAQPQAGGPQAAPGSGAWPPAVPGPHPWPAAPTAAGTAGPAGTVPATSAASPEEPFLLPDANWRWPQAIAGLVLGSAPEALLYLAALLAGTATSTGGKVTAGSAAALAVGSLILYGWQLTSAWLFSLRTAGRTLALWGFRRPTRAIFWTIPLGLVAVYAVGIAHDLVVHPEQQKIVNAFPHSGIGVALFVLVAVIMAPLFEEIVFRGFLFRGLANSWGWAWGALASSAVFGLAHLQLDVFLPLAALGFALAWAYKQTGSLWTCIAMHGLFNLIAVAAWVATG